MEEKWSALRYRGDLEDLKELNEYYRIEGYLSTYEERVRREKDGIRERLLADGVRLSEKISPRVYGIYKDVCGKLGLDSEAEIFCVGTQSINAFASIDLTGGRVYSVIGITSEALEKLDDKELASILGHEIGHFLFGHNRLNALIHRDSDGEETTVLPSFGESLFLRWRKKAEISADRVGLISCGSFEKASRSLIKATFGLSEKNLNLDIDSLLGQLDEIRGGNRLVLAGFESHPLIPMRLEALRVFSGSRKAWEYNHEVGEKDGISDEDLENWVDEIIEITKKHPTNPLDIAVMNALGSAGVYVLKSDKDIDDEEIKILVEILHSSFTEEPEKVIVTEPEGLKRQMDESLKYIREKGTDSHKTYLLSRLADIALADGVLREPEVEAVLEVAEKIGETQKDALGILVGAAHAVGFKVDAKLNEISKRIKKRILS